MNRWLRRLFLVLSIGGGFAGLAFTGSQLLQPSHPLLYYVVCFVVCLAYIQGILSGLVLVENEAEGVRQLSWYFLAQVPVFISPVISYQFSVGAWLTIIFGTMGVRGSAQFGSQWAVALLQLNDRTVGIGANAFAIWATWYLRMVLRRKCANKAPVPTSGTVTPPAGPGVEPVPPVANL